MDTPPNPKADPKAEEKRRGPPDAVLAHLSQINAAIAAIQSRLDDQTKQAKKDFDDHRRMREEDLRMIMARVANVGTNVSYLRENVCETLKEQVRETWGLGEVIIKLLFFQQKTALTEAVNKELRGVTEAVERATYVEVAVFRDMMLQAFPGLMHLSVVAATPTPAPTPSGAETPMNEPAPVSHLPPEAALDLSTEETEEDTDTTEKDLIEAINQNTPFSDDLEIFDILRMKGAVHYLIKEVEAKKPDSLAISTADGKFVEFIISTLFAQSYVEDHAIPRSMEVSNYPFVPKKLIFALHRIGEHGMGREEFDIEEYWRLIRTYFANSSFTPAAGKPTVGSLINQALGAVADEVNQELLVKKLPAGTYSEYVKEQKSLRDSPVNTAVGQEQPLQEHEADDHTSLANETLLNLRTRTVRASKTTETAKSAGGVHTRRRTHDEVATEETDERKAASNKKPKY